MKIKSKDVARALGVSAATVSLALNNKPGVNEETRKKIQDYVKWLEYKNVNQSDQLGRSIKMIVYVEDGVTEEDNGYLFSLSYMEVFRITKEAGFNLKLVYFNEGKDNIYEIIEECRHDSTAGIWLASAGHLRKEQYEPFRNLDIPLVIYGNDFDDPKKDCVVINNRLGIKEGMDYLYQLGHRDIMYFANTRPMKNFKERENAFIEFMDERGLLTEKNPVVPIGRTISQICENMAEYIGMGKHMPTAICCGNYAVSLGVIKALERCHYRIPEDVSVIGFDELPASTSSLLNFQFSHIKVMHSRMAHLAIERLIGKILGDTEETVKIVVSCEFVAGDSVKRIER